MQCLACHHQNPPDAAFCDECGARMESQCLTCGASNRGAAKFCRSCGRPLTVIDMSDRPGFRTDLGSTPKHLAEKILLSKAALEGERKQVTVLFADLKGSMEMLAERDPEEARKILDPVLERMMEAVHHFEGTVNQVMGDGIMALFGAPLSQEDHAVRACYAALRMQEAIARYGDELQRTQGIPVQLRVGLNSGEVVVRTIGNDLRMDYSAIGQTTHLAARMEQMAKAGTVLLTPQTLKLAEGYVQVKALGAMAVKGFHEPLEVFELTGASIARTRLQAAASRGLTRFVGRQRELEVLADAMGKARESKGQAVAIVGEPGVGKSRLYFEFTHSHRTQGWLIVEAGSVSYGKATPYLPVIDLLKGYFHIGERDEARGIREKVTGKLLTLDRALEALLWPILSLLDQPTLDPAWDKLDPPQRRRQTLDALKRLWLREAQAQPLILVFEDLHWIDSETQEFLNGLMDSVPAARVLLLFNYRPEYRHPWGSKTYYHQLRLDPLSQERAQDLLDALLGGDPTLQPLKHLLIERTEGNPFYLEESVRALMETGALSGEKGNMQLTKPIESIDVPATVQAILAARIDRLQPEDKRLLQTAAVIGKDVPYAILQAVAEQTEANLRESLSRLQAAEFLYEASLFPDLEYTFKHALTHEVAYNGLLQDRKRELHERILETIDNLYRGRMDDQVERLAHHAVRARRWDKAVSYLRQAGLRAWRRSANREAVSYLEEALSALREWPGGRDAEEMGIDLRLDLSRPLRNLGEFPRTREYLETANRLALEINDNSRRGRILVRMAHVLTFLGSLEEAIEHAREALALPTMAKDWELGLWASFHLGVATYYSGNLDASRTRWSNVLSALPASARLDYPGLPVFAQGYIARSLLVQGRARDAVEEGETALRVAEKLEHPFPRAWMLYQLGSILEIQNEAGRGVNLIEQSVAALRELELDFEMPFALAALGDAYVSRGRGDDGLKLLAEAERSISTLGVKVPHSIIVAGLAKANLALKRLDVAKVSAQRSLSMAHTFRERVHEAEALRLLGDIASQRESLVPGVAESHYRESLSIAEQGGYRLVEAHCLLGLGKLFSKINWRAEAREHLTKALSMFRQMELHQWPERVESVLRGL